MKANTGLWLLVLGWFILGLPIAVYVCVSSIIQLQNTQTNTDKLKYGISIVVSILYIIFVVESLL